MKHHAPPARLASQGISLIEIMVAMAIGLVVIGAVLSTYLHSRAGSRQAAALAQVTEDASLAMGILRSHVSMAGYGQPTGTGSSFQISRLTGKAIVGCDGGFNGSMVIDPSRVNCANGTASDALIVRYEVDDRNGPQISDDDGNILPSDCQGTGLTKGTGDYAYFVSDSRFSIGSGTGVPTALECRGSGGIATTKADATAAATAIFGKDATLNPSVSLVNNIQDMQIIYGVGKSAGVEVTLDDGSKVTKPDKRVATYLKASSVGAPTSANWEKVVSIRVCMVVRSEEEVLDAPTSYHGCDNATANPTTVVTPTDRRIYRAFTTTIVLNNRI